MLGIFQKVGKVSIGVVLLMVFFIGGWKEKSLGFMDKEQLNEYRKIVFKKQFESEKIKPFADGFFSYSGQLYSPAFHRTSLLYFITWGNQGEEFNYTLDFQVKDGIVSGKSRNEKVNNKNENCSYKIMGKVTSFGIEFEEKFAEKCTKGVDWIEKKVLLKAGHITKAEGKVITYLQGPWISCASFTEFCSSGGHAILNLNDFKNKKQMKSQVSIYEGLVGKSFVGTLWQYHPSQSDNGDFINTEEGKEYSVELVIKSHIGNKEDGLFEIFTLIKNGSDDIGEIKGQASVVDGKLIVTEKEITKQVYTSWELKTYALSLSDFEKGSASSHWHAVDYEPNGGFIKFQTK